MEISNVGRRIIPSQIHTAPAGDCNCEIGRRRPGLLGSGSGFVWPARR
jgi:hypothetical protein